MKSKVSVAPFSATGPDQGVPPAPRTSIGPTLLGTGLALASPSLGCSAWLHDIDGRSG
jgi:hypothetical protein